jgi:hypothetical protein
LDKAYDEILNCVVAATVVEDNNDIEPYRYSCLCCGEEVCIAAVTSEKVVAHFRHRRGNFNKECEEYSGNYGFKGRDLNVYKKTPEFYFDIKNKFFCIGIKFAKTQIEEYEAKGALFKLVYYNNGKFLDIVRKEINFENFYPDEMCKFEIDAKASIYYSSISDGSLQRDYEIFKKDAPTFFKIIGINNKLAKMIQSNVIYTNTRYFIVNPRELVINWREIDIDIEEHLDFERFDFRCVIAKFRTKNSILDKVLEKLGYIIKNSEELTILWPPTFRYEDNAEIYSNKVFLYTKIDLIANSNIKIDSKDLIKSESNIYKILLRESAKVYTRNHELTFIPKTKTIKTYENIDVERKFLSIFKVPEDNIYFLFNSFGIEQLIRGQTIYLTPNSCIKQYCGGYLVKEIFPIQQKKLGGKALLIDVCKHTKMMDEFDLEQFSSVATNQDVSDYIRECEKTGLINSIAKLFILEGKI